MREITQRSEIFLLDAGRWRGAAAISKLLRQKVGDEWEVKKAQMFSRSTVLVEAEFKPTAGMGVYYGDDEPTQEAPYTPAPPITAKDLEEATPETREALGHTKVEEEKQLVMGEDIFSKTQMRKVQIALAEEKKTRQELEKLVKRQAAEKKKLEEQTKPQQAQLLFDKKVVTPPKRVYKRRKSKMFKKGYYNNLPDGSSAFTTLRDCVLRHLSETETFDSETFQEQAKLCGTDKYGIKPNVFTPPAIGTAMRCGYIGSIGVVDGKTVYRVTAKGKKYLEVNQSENDKHTV